ncbi:MAG: hypothetical protein RMJ34_00235 [candidate division WOR-3 bacterium]|nr:hypothetical protein [candidate division WOR-3 bacterium]MDW8113350.1 hypothetical protein [candidate division WOR-3 bacterium]
MSLLIFLCFFLPPNLRREETFVINDSSLIIYLKDYPIIKNSETLYFQENFLKKDDYSIDYEKGIIEIKRLPNLLSSFLKVTYFYLPFSYYPLSPIVVRKIENDSFSLLEKDDDTISQNVSSDIIFEGEKEFKVNYHTKEGVNFSQQTNFSLQGNINEINFEGSFNGKENSEEGFLLKELDNSYLKMKTKSISFTFGNQKKEADFFNFGKVSSYGIGLSLSQTNIYETLYFHYLTTPFKYEKIGFYGKDFIQGPYYLKKDKSIKILKNSERVYLDGNLLKRGDNEDYLIDYELGFIIFTNRRIITSRNFIEIDFLYEEEIYEKDNYYINLSSSRLPIKTNLNWHWEKDKNKKELFDEETKNYLKKIGNDTTKAYLTSAKYVGKNKGDYEKIGEIFFYVGENKGSYLVDFTFVGESLGDYNYDNIKNCYYYVGKNKGRYLPYSKIKLPKENLFTSINLEIPLKENLKFQFGGIVNKRDENLFSPYGDTNPYGYGTDFSLSYEKEKFSFIFKNLTLFRNQYLLNQLKNEEFINFPLKNKTTFQINLSPNRYLNFLNQLNIIKKEKGLNYFGFNKFNFLFNELSFKKDYPNKKIFNFSTSPTYRFFAPSYSFISQIDNDKHFLIHTFGINFYFKKSKTFLNYEIEKERKPLIKKRKITKFGITNENNPYTSFLIGFLENSLFSDFNFNYSFKNIFQLNFLKRLINEEEVSYEIRFIKVKKGEGNYSKDTITNEYYLDPSGEYLKEILPLRKGKRVLKMETKGNLLWQPIKKLKLNFFSTFASPKTLECQFLTDYHFKENLTINYKINYSQQEEENLIFENYKNKRIENFLSLKKELSELLTLTGIFQLEKGEKKKRENYFQKEKNYGFYNLLEFKENYNLNLKPGISFLYYQYLLPFREDYLIKKISLNLEKNSKILKDFYLNTLLEIIYRIYPQEDLPLELNYYEPKGFSYNITFLITKNINQNLAFNWEFNYLKEGFKEKEIKLNFSSRIYF